MTLLLRILTLRKLRGPGADREFVIHLVVKSLLGQAGIEACREAQYKAPAWKSNYNHLQAVFKTPFLFFLKKKPCVNAGGVLFPPSFPKTFRKLTLPRYFAGRVAAVEGGRGCASPCKRGPWTAWDSLVQDLGPTMWGLCKGP